MTMEDFYESHKAAADRILSCNSSSFTQILGLKEPIIRENARAAFELLSNLLVPECNSGTQYERAQEAHDWLYTAARHYGVDMTEYFGNNYAPPLFTKEYGCRSTMRGNVNPCYHCDQPKFIPGGSKDDYFSKMKQTTDRVLQCDPNDFHQVLDIKNALDVNDACKQLELDAHFWETALYLSPFVMPLGEAGPCLEEQKKAFKILIAAARALQVSQNLLDEHECKNNTVKGL